MTTSIQKDSLLSQFSVLAYQDKDFLNNPANLPSGWTLKDDSVSPPFAAFAFKNDATGEVIIAYRGTDGIGDGSADKAILAGTWDPQFQQGMDFAKSVRANQDIFPNGPASADIFVTGHSLGGAIAQIVAQAYGLDGSTIDPGAAQRIVNTAEFKEATLAAGLPEGGRGAASGLTNYLVVGSLISGGTGAHIGSTSALPSLTFSGEQGLTAFLIGLINPVAGFVYAIATDQFSNKHASTQISQALGLLAGVQDGNGATAGSIKLVPKETGSVDPVTGQPVYSQTEFEIRDAVTGALQSTVKFSGSGTERMLEVFDGVSGALQSTTTLAATGAITTRPVIGSSVEISYVPDVTTNLDGTVTVVVRDSQGAVVSTKSAQTFDDGSTISTTTYPNGDSQTITTNTDGTLFQKSETKVDASGNPITTITSTDNNADGVIDNIELDLVGANGTVVGPEINLNQPTVTTTATTDTADTIARNLENARTALASEDRLLVNATEVRLLSGAQSSGETWGGGRILELGESELAGWYKSSAADYAQQLATGTVENSTLVNGFNGFGTDNAADLSSYVGLGLLPGWNLGSTTSFASYGSGGNTSTPISNSPPAFDLYADLPVVFDPTLPISATPINYAPPIDLPPMPDPVPSDYDPYGYFAPVVFDLDGDGIELIDQQDSHAYFDVKGDGNRHNVGWVGADDAMLAIDKNNDGLINQADELSFAMWTANPNDSDMDGLKAVFDTNHNGLLDAGDARYADMRVWQDKNGDGVSDAGELMTLAQAGIASLNLTPARTSWSQGGNQVNGFSTYARTNGTLGWARDVALR